MTFGGPRKIIVISACLVLVGGLVWGCTHQAQIVLPNSNSTQTLQNQNQPTLNTNTTNPGTDKVYAENANTAVAETGTTNQAESTNQVEPSSGNETSSEAINESTEENVEGEEADVVDVEAQERDVERVARITQIQQALALYKGQHQAFPEALDMLADGFLAEIPKDVDGDDFSYTPIGALPAQFYDLCYELEVGTETITAGYHCASPEGVAHP